jgi:D-alanyl-D-alanine carboxypeptidase (penicillin-binding protein 5/6)
VKNIRENKEGNSVNDDFETEEELERTRRRRERILRMKREKERRIKIQKMVKIGVPVAALLLVIGGICGVRSLSTKAQPDTRDAGQASVQEEQEVSNPAQDEDTVSAGNLTAGEQPGDDLAANGGEAARTGASRQYSAHTTAQTQAPPEEVNSTNVVFLEVESGDILAQRDYRAVISPASMTKVLTVLVAAERVTNLDDTFTMTIDITDYSYSNDCSSVGFSVGENVTVRDLFYGTILPSGGDAAVALATYVAGSHEAFVELMNEKAEELGLSDTAHFTNCVGLYDEQHHCTVYDMAMIMEAAMDNELCREVLQAHTYTTSSTEQHPEGITISNWFLRRIEDKDTGGEVLCAKTGFVVQSGSCAVSYGVDADGREYICATTGAYSSWRCIYDHVALYKQYME